MTPGDVVAVQACGCISLSVEVARQLQIGPRTELQVNVDPDHATLVLTRVSPPRLAVETAERAACPLLEAAP